jgi:hypothetical protein
VGKINLIIDDKIEKRFRDTVYRRKGMKKGNLTDSVEEAMILWVSTGTQEKE